MQLLSISFQIPHSEHRISSKSENFIFLRMLGQTPQLTIEMAPHEDLRILLLRTEFQDLTASGANKNATSFVLMLANTNRHRLHALEILSIQIVFLGLDDRATLAIPNNYLTILATRNETWLLFTSIQGINSSCVSLDLLTNLSTVPGHEVSAHATCIKLFVV